MTKRAIVALVLTLTSCLSTALAQPPAQPASSPSLTQLSFAEYMARVGELNIAAIAARARLPIAEHGIDAARVRPNPFVTLGLAQVDVSGQGAPTGTWTAFGVPIELGGKRRRRVSLASATAEFVQADLETTLRQIRLDAALAFVDALEADRALAIRRASLEGFERLVEVNRHRFELGDIDETTYLQSRVEAERYRADLLDAEGQADASHVTLGVYASGEITTTIAILPEGNLEIAARAYDAETLLAAALEHRPEVVAARRSVTVAQRQVDVARGLRIVDLQLTLGWQHNASTNVTQFRQHSNDTVGLTLTLPLPFSNRYHGFVDAARATVTQQELILDADRLQVGVEVQRAVVLYRSAVRRVEVYENGLLEGADRVLERVLYEYQRGGATLLEVINAQRTANEVHMGHVAAHADHARAMIELEAAVGTWNIDL